MLEMKRNLLITIGVLVLALAGYFAFAIRSSEPIVPPVIDSAPMNVTLSGTYTCLPYLENTNVAEAGDECVFGLLTDDGVYYMVNFGASANAMQEFKSGAHITAKGFIVLKEILSTDHWMNYNMKGIFTITERL
jgi:hypothetical protein